MNVRYTSTVGHKARAFHNICCLYFKPEYRVLDATYGMGGFWKLIKDLWYVPRSWTSSHAPAFTSLVTPSSRFWRWSPHRFSLKSGRLRLRNKNQSAVVTSQRAVPPVEVDLHGYYPGDIYSGLLIGIVQQAWEMGTGELVILHGHGRDRGITPGFINTRTGVLRLDVPRMLRDSPELRSWILRSTIYRGDSGLTSVRLKHNPAPSRTSLEL